MIFYGRTWSLGPLQVPSSAAVSSVTAYLPRRLRLMSFERLGHRRRCIRQVDTSYLEKQASVGSYTRNILQCNRVRVWSCTTMSVDDILFGLILCGIGLAGACFKSEFVLLREQRTAERRKERGMREVAIKKIFSPHGRGNFQRDRVSAI